MIRIASSPIKGIRSLNSNADHCMQDPDTGLLRLKVIAGLITRIALIGALLCRELE